MSSTSSCETPQLQTDGGSSKAQANQVLFTSGLAWSFPSSFPIYSRDSIAPGSPLYECHADCGGVILLAQYSNNTTGYCLNSTYKSDLSGCLKCALTYNIGQYYGDDVKSAMEACGDSATPSTSSATASATAVSNSSTTGTGAKVTGSASSTASAASASGTSTSGGAVASMSLDKFR
ncbi:uncharacterized protein BP01DRAFT_380940 [Aspergillus saccharolyticus JOP 1030-1]|uniref:Uncharacterized protein n=1 Tax=Aspergillus saccharolyticus JOP 1030-1 TaxID=1450539 RepID=A0A318ZJS3_9EURO|nr:hypothetical protein BP01DRAFT_380940 [Aspergillus saccharolyticus JOP 1030-1]PYH47097.1 hypothetical protein BP01DRAFT_380940 [Aspergillus saccharolyticus JOP 1030-1]